jgi:group II intron reverse transcriptase/maturase
LRNYSTDTVLLLGERTKESAIYSRTIQKESLHKAFTSLKVQPVPGIDSIVKVNFGKSVDTQLSKLHKELKSHQYEVSPLRITYTKKLDDGKKRPLGLSSLRDKFVQSAFKMELEKLYEPEFSVHSYGFRPNLSCHSAMKQIKKNWQDAKWIISLDIKKCFGRVHHDVLISVLQKRVADQEFIEVIRKFLKVGYVDIHNLIDREAYGLEGVPQNSIISPLLCNIYLHELDKFVESTLLLKYSHKKTSVIDKAKKLRSLSGGIGKTFTSFGLSKIPDSNYRRSKTCEMQRRWEERSLKRESFLEKRLNKSLHYVRYADNILLGVTGSKEDCRLIIFKINSFLQKELKLELDKKGCKINLAAETQTEFLGLSISTCGAQGAPLAKSKVGVCVNSLALLVPIKSIVNRLIKRGLLRRVHPYDRFKGTGVGGLICFSDRYIVEYFSSIISAYTNYYICANYRSVLWRLVNALRESCYLTLK